MRVIESRYREVLDGAPGPWIAGPTVPDGARDLQFEGQELGRTYEAQIRRVDTLTGEVTRWIPVGTHVIGFRRPQLAPPRNLRVVCGKALTWDPPDGVTEPGALRYRILHAPREHRRAPDMVPAVLGWPGSPPFDLCLIPRGIRTLCVIPVDDEGQEGEPSFVLTDRGPFDDAEPVEGRETALEPAWTNPKLTVEGGTVAGDVVQQDAVAGALGEQPFYIGRGCDPFYRGRGADDFYVQVYEEMTLTLKGYYSGSKNGAYDLLVDRGVLTLDLQLSPSVNWRAEYRRNSSPFYIGDGGDPFYIGTGESLFRHGLSGEDPFYGAGGDEFYEDGGAGDFYRVHPFRPWPGRLGGLGPTRIDFRLVVPASWLQASVSRFAVRESVPAKGGRWHSGQGAPEATLGEVGDFYLDAASGDFYEKQTPGTWLLQGNLTGPAGSAADGWLPGIVIDWRMFTAAGTSKTVDVFHLPAGKRIAEVLWVPSELWGGGLLASVLGDVGSDADLERYLVDVDLTTAPGGDVFEHGSGAGPQDVSVATAVNFTVEGDAVLSNLSSGRGTLYLRVTGPEL